MMIDTDLSILGDIDLDNPVNWNCSLNRGLVFWLKCLPGRMGGTRFWDLLGRYAGTFNDTWGGSAWGNAGPPGSLGSLSWVNANARLGFPSSVANWNWNTPATWICSVYFVNVTFSQSIAGHWSGTGWRVFIPSNAGLRFSLDSNSGANVLAQQTNAGVLSLGWQRIAVTLDGSGQSSGLHLYVNGVLNGTGVFTNTLGTATTTSSDIYVIGRGGNGAQATSGLTAGARIDSNRIYNRALSAAEIAWEYQDSLLGCPWSLNRISGLTAAQQAAAYAAYYRMLQQNIGAAA